MAALEDTMWWYRALHDSLVDRLRRLDLGSGAKVLDAGCGTGGLLARLSRDAPGPTYTGLEHDAEAASIAKTKSDATIYCGSVNALPFQSEQFDVIVSADVLCHGLVNEAAAFREFYRCLKARGYLLLNLPAYNWMKSSHDSHVHNVRRYTVSGAKRLAESSGFRIADSGYWNSLLLPLILLYRLTVGRGKAESDVRAFQPWQDRLFYAATVLERRLARAGLRPPFGGSVWVAAVKP